MKAIQCCYFLALVSSHLMAGVMGDDNIFLSNSDSAALYCVAKIFPDGENILIYKVNIINAREGANKRGNSSRLTQSFHFFMFEPIFSPVNALNQPI
ncbi:hypothetical protein G902_04283 [Escherichia coli UMEA 3052-1]|uniref:hypothetical protein n=1 Tax=Escherichia coli TaxID=562 RepID=UPI00038FAB76|nr:hypothetical protein G902_04283 [Escherichia coli UMEA 3052-1]